MSVHGQLIPITHSYMYHVLVQTDFCVLMNVIKIPIAQQHQWRKTSPALFVVTTGTFVQLIVFVKTNDIEQRQVLLFCHLGLSACLLTDVFAKCVNYLGPAPISGSLAQSPKFIPSSYTCARQLQTAPLTASWRLARCAAP